MAHFTRIRELLDLAMTECEEGIADEATAERPDPETVTELGELSEALAKLRASIT
jgi:hypothetical protein